MLSVTKNQRKQLFLLDSRFHNIAHMLAEERNRKGSYAREDGSGRQLVIRYRQGFYRSFQGAVVFCVRLAAGNSPSLCELAGPVWQFGRDYA